MKTKQLESGLYVSESVEKEIKQKPTEGLLLHFDEDRNVAHQCLFRLYGQVANNWRFTEQEQNQAQLDAIRKLARELIRPDWEYDGEILC